MSDGNRQTILELVAMAEASLPSSDSGPARPQTPLPPPPGCPKGTYECLSQVCPPPGLVQTFPPMVPPTRTVRDTDISIFSDLVPFLDTGIDQNGYKVIADLTCSICHDCKLVASRSISAHLLTVPPAELEELTVLPCGHFFGWRCLREWLHSLVLDGLNPSCPLCRFELMYDKCGHYIDPVKYDTTRMRREQLPLTLPEGGSVLSLCDACYGYSLALHMANLMDFLNPDGVTPQDFKSDEAAGALERELGLQTDGIWEVWDMRSQYNRW